jgi:ubiquinone/menaquinone biosynthesis C-methylase UbiE
MAGNLFNHKEVSKLEDPERLVWLPPGEALQALGIRAGMRIADIGAGSGYFAIPFAHACSPAPLAAVDLQPEMLEFLRAKLRNPGSPANISLLQGSADCTGLESGAWDLAFLGQVWHEVKDRPAAIREAARILAPEGRLAILDWRADCPPPPGPPLDHRIDASAVAAELTAAGWRVEGTTLIGSRSYLAVATRPRL